MTKFPALLVALSLPLLVNSQTTPEIEWQRCMGGSDSDQSQGLLQTEEGDYVIIATTSSLDGDILVPLGSSDIWITKLGSDGELLWQQSLGGTSSDNGKVILSTTNGGLVALGQTYSDDGHVTGYYGGGDIWLMELSAGGDLEWQRTYGGSSFDQPSDLVLSADGGYVIVGSTFSEDGDVTENNGNRDAWIIKVDAAGSIEWQQTMGGSDWDEFHSVVQTQDGGYAMVGASRSSDGDLSTNQGDFDLWIVKVNEDGALIWQATYGGTMSDFATSVRESSTGDLIVVGSTGSDDGDVTGYNGGAFDAWVLHLSSTGALQWQRCFGGSNRDLAQSQQLTTDNGITMLCSSRSTDGDVSGVSGLDDHWLVRLNSNGDLIWQLAYGGSAEDTPTDLLLTADGGFATVGYTASNNGDVSGNHGGMYDVWAVKLSADPTSITESNWEFELQMLPNPTAGDAQLRFTLERAASVQVEVRDMQGKLLDVVFSGQGTPGQHLLTLPFTERPAGNYLVGLRVDGLLVMKKLVRL